MNKNGLASRVITI